jgi:hypothetical protein
LKSMRADSLPIRPRLRLLLQPRNPLLQWDTTAKGLNSRISNYKDCIPQYFLTQKSFLGKGPETLLSDDLVCIMHRADIPFVLRAIFRGSPPPHQRMPLGIAQPIPLYKYSDRSTRPQPYHAWGGTAKLEAGGCANKGFYWCEPQKQSLTFK